AGLGRPGAGSVRRIEHVDVDRDVERLVADPRPDAVDGCGYAVLLDEFARDDGESEALVVFEVAFRIQRTPDADMHAGGEIDEALLRRAAERRAMRGGGAEVGVPRVEVRV